MLSQTLSVSGKEMEGQTNLNKNKAHGDIKKNKGKKGPIMGWKCASARKHHLLWVDATQVWSLEGWWPCENHKMALLPLGYVVLYLKIQVGKHSKDGISAPRNP